ncbi:hypothetical protein B0T25DRAFT_555495 [Lasiosphaeria hispida]|uniref:Uncharacterized protein n=1 Tax=Lasiosphaeria hispida TaxID=260671 RepID=A0AAJ0H8V9_9PEZI|nr:hypothetical protein B0T25DRAFT_555495 [Lasiosphaeria hispida]
MADNPYALRPGLPPRRPSKPSVPHPAPASAAITAPRELRPSEKIPALTNVVPSIFVPLRDSDWEDTAIPRDRVERLRRILESIDYQREGVKENLMYMFEREKQRVILVATEQLEREGQARVNPGLDPREADLIIQNMEAPPEPGYDYNIKDMPPINTRRPLPDTLSVRDRAVNDILNVMEAGILNLTGYGNHMADIKKYYLDCLEKELARVEAAGLRPEERLFVDQGLEAGMDP